MKVLAFDPGYDRLGVAVMERHDHTDRLLYSNCLMSERKSNLSVRLHFLGTAIEKILKKHRPDLVALESIFFNKNQKTAIAVAEARGMIVFLAKKHGALVEEFGPQEVKVAVTGYGRSDKRAIRDMLRRLVANLPEKRLDDEYDAIAVGVTALAHRRKTG